MQRAVLPAAAGIPEQLAVVWQHGAPRSLFSFGLLQREGGGWRRVYVVRTRLRYESAQLQTGDVTADGHLDVLVSFVNGSGGCGPRRLLATERARTRVIFYENSCDTNYTLRHGRLVLDAGWYTLQDSHCCPTYTRRTVLRWNGSRLVRSEHFLYVTCLAVSCKRRRVAFHFHAVRTRFWDARRGFATGGAHPWLIATTRDGGAHWSVALVSRCPAAALQEQPRGHGAVHVGACRVNGVRTNAQTVTTRDYGVHWLEP